MKQLPLGSCFLRLQNLYIAFITAQQCPCIVKLVRKKQTL